MYLRKIQVLLAMGVIALGSFSYAATQKVKEIDVAPYTSTKIGLAKLTPDAALQILEQGNTRFVNNQTKRRDLLRQAKGTAKYGQFPFAVILSCMDSRGSAELLFDQGIGDVFSIRVAGNVIDTDQLGSMEFATKAVGSKVVLVMGHTACGAVAGACRQVELGNLTALLHKIEPAVSTFKSQHEGKVNCDDYAQIDQIAKLNVMNMLQSIKDKSSIIKEQAEKHEIMLVGGMQDLRTGKVIFFDEQGNILNK